MDGFQNDASPSASPEPTADDADALFPSIRFIPTLEIVLKLIAWLLNLIASAANLTRFLSSSGKISHSKKRSGKGYEAFKFQQNQVKTPSPFFSHCIHLLFFVI